jgi:hypothetical protein
MYYLAILGVPLLMLIDYYLTLSGAVLRESSGYARIFVGRCRWGANYWLPNRKIKSWPSSCLWL